MASKSEHSDSGDIAGQTKFQKHAPESTPTSQSKSNSQGKPETKKGRPRNKESKRKILEVASKMAREKSCFKEVSIEAIANQAKVSKATIYRWWKNKSELLREACLVGHFKVPDTGSLNRDLRALIHQEIAVQTTQISRAVLAGLMAEVAEHTQKPCAANMYNGCPFAEEKISMIEAVFRAAIERGEWEGEVNVYSLHEVTLGAIFFRCVILGGTLSNLEIEGLVNVGLQVAKPNQLSGLDG